MSPYCKRRVNGLGRSMTSALSSPRALRSSFTACCILANAASTVCCIFSRPAASRDGHRAESESAKEAEAAAQAASQRPFQILLALFVQATACAFRFLRQPSRPIAPRPVAKSGRAAGTGVPII